MQRARALRVSSHSTRRSAAVDALERRTLLTTFTVTNVADAGPGSLRDAIEMANLSAGSDEVRFNIPGDGLYRTITPLTPLPEITGPLVISGQTQPGYFSSPVVELNGSSAGAGANGLTVSAPLSTVRGLVINRFDGHGVVLSGARPPSPSRPGVQGAIGARVDACYIGTDVTGNVALPNSGAGIWVAASGTQIGSEDIRVPAPAVSYRNVISGNGFAGVWIAQGPVPSSSVGGTTMINNYIGTNASGNRALGNGREGILMESPGSLTVGGRARTPTLPPSRNVISGNAASGIRVSFPTGSGPITIQNTYIGTDASGSNALGNGQSPVQPFRDGITVAAMATVQIGMTQPLTRNLISGNLGAGVAVHSGGDVQVVGNFIGTDAAGNAPLGNGGDGVVATGAQTATHVTGNVISGNGGDGVHVVASARSVSIGGNYIGTNATGVSALGNGGDGVDLTNVMTPATVGGAGGFIPSPTTPLQVLYPGSTGRNVISANRGNGVQITGDTTRGGAHNVTSNYIGTDFAGIVPLGNAGSGIHLATTGAVIGGPSSGSGNLISANGVNGITIVGAAATTPGSALQQGNRIEGNRIGVAALPRPGFPAIDDAVMGNRHHGVAIFYSPNNRIGTGTSSGGNVIAYNGGNGVLVQGATGALPNSPQLAEGNAISANSIHNNGKLGIDLAATGEGVTPNDLRDTDVGPNRLQNHPIVTDAVAVPGSSVVNGRFTLHAEPLRNYRLEIFANIAPDPTGRGEGHAFVTAVNVTTDAGGNATGAFNGTYTLSVGRTAPAVIPFITATATEGTRNTSEFSPAVRAVLPQGGGILPVPLGSARVVGRHVFYNNSAFDQAGGDDAAIATDKQALLPGQQPSFANVTSYPSGINGVMVDIAGLPAGVLLTPEEFEARAAGSSGDFADTHKPFAVNVRRGAGVNGSDRVTLYWSDNLPNVDGVAPAVANGWLEVKVLASAVTGLAVSDVFSFGNLAGETGNPTGASGSLRVDAFDFARTRAAAAPDAAAVTSRFDHNRDGVVNGQDLAVVRANYARGLAPAAAAAKPVVVAAAASSRPGFRPKPEGRLAEELLA